MRFESGAATGCRPEKLWASWNPGRCDDASVGLASAGECLLKNKTASRFIREAVSYFVVN
jgi:hypothetical protein